MEVPFENLMFTNSPLTSNISLKTGYYCMGQQSHYWKREYPVGWLNPNLRSFRWKDPYTSSAAFHTDSGLLSVNLLILVFERKTTSFFIQVFIPITMLVMVSWIGFFISVKDPLLKSFISLLSLSTLVIAFTVMNNELPSVNSIRALDVWVGTCTIFIIAALIESVIAYLRNGCEKTEFENLKGSEEKIDVSLNHSKSLVLFIE